MPKIKNYKNIIEANHLARNIKKICGLQVFETVTSSDGKLVPKFSFLGLFAFLIWVSIYFYCWYVSIKEDQTILRLLHTTKLEHYGDVFERTASVIYFLYTMWKLPFDILLRNRYLQQVTDIDKAIEKLNVPVDYKKNARPITMYTILIIVVALSQFLSVLVAIRNLELDLPFEIMFRANHYDILILSTTAHYCLYVNYLKIQYKEINGVLKGIKKRTAWEYKVLNRGKPVNIVKIEELQEKYVCEKIKSCARIYSMLYKAHKTGNVTFGFSILLTMFLCLLYIVLYLFYFMEATATGLFHDMPKYVYFLVYASWQILYALAVIFFMICFSDKTVAEASIASYATHEIVNYHKDPAVTAQAMQLSLQLLHQMPEFTACGLYKLDYVLLLQGGTTVTTLLVILLQFVTA